MKNLVSIFLMFLFSMNLYAQVVQERVYFSAGGGSEPNIPVSIGEPFGGSNENITIGSQQGFNICSSTVLIIDLNSTNILCNGSSTGSINASVSGGTEAYTFLWSNGSESQNLMELSEGNYTLAVTDGNGCQASSQSIIITEPEPLLVNEEILPGEINLNVTGGTPPYSFNWSNDSTSQNLTELDFGGYSCTITDANDCTLNIGPFVLTNVTVAADRRIILFPNPVEDELKVLIIGTSPEEEFSIVIYDIQGKEIIRNNEISQTGILSTKNLTPGTYTASVISKENNIIFSQKIIKK